MGIVDCIIALLSAARPVQGLRRAHAGAAVVLALLALLAGAVPDTAGRVIAQPPPVSTEENIAPGSISITGTVINGTAGAQPLPVGQPVKLRIVQVNLQSGEVIDEEQRQATTDSSGRYMFADVPRAADLVYAVVTRYRDTGFASEIVDATTLQNGALELPVTVYELTDDRSYITISSIDMQITTISQGRLQIVQQVTFRNSSDRAFRSDFGGTLPTLASVAAAMPPGAGGLFVQNPQRFITLETEGILIDTLPVMPGEHQMQFTYFLPYNDIGAIVEFPIFYAFVGSLNLFVSPTVLRASGADMAPGEPEQTGSHVYLRYTQPYNILSNVPVRFELSGNAGTGAPETLPTNSAVIPAESLPLVLFGAGMLLVAGIVLVARRRRQPGGTASASDPARQIDLLTRRIAALDDQHDAGQINHDVYQQHRAALKAQLTALLEHDATDDDER